MKHYIWAVSALVMAGSVCAETTNELDAIVVTAPRLKRDALTEPGSEPVGLVIATSEVTSGDLARQNPASLSEALAFAPGAWTESRGRKVKQFTSFRGQTYPYPDYAIDGMWFREFHELPYFFPPSELERIEINRSSSALTTGLSGLSGVINLVPKRYAQRTTRLEAEYGTDNYQRYYASHAEPIPNGGVVLSAGHQSTDGEEGMNNAEEMSTASARANWSPGEQFEWDTFLFLLDGMRELELAQDPAAGGLQARVEEFDSIQSVLAGTRLRYHAMNNRATTQFSLWGADREAHYIRHDTGTTHDDDDYEYGIQLMQSVVPVENNILRFGGLYHRWVAPDGKRFYAGKRNDIETWSAVVVDEHDFGRLKLDAGYRYSREYLNDYALYNVEGSGSGLGAADPIQNEWAQPLHRFNTGGSLDIANGAALYANYSFGQLDAPPGALEPDNTPTGREARHMADFGIAFDGEKLGLLKTGVFGVYRDEGIHAVANTYTNSIGLEVPYYENRDGRQLGFEAEWRSPWYWNRASLFASTQLMFSEAEVDGSYERDREIPEQLYAAGLYLREGGFDASLFGKYVGPYENNRFSAGGIYRSLGDYFELNCTGGYTFGQRLKTRVFVALKNLLDDNYSTVVGYYDRGFRMSAGVQATF